MDLENNYNGWLVLDKSYQISSARELEKVKSLFGYCKAGHSGTLDRLATGVLPIAMGEATKTISYAMEGKKKYIFTVRWGESRSTDDIEGDIIFSSEVRPNEKSILNLIPEFIGIINQRPPTYSAIKVDGRRSSDWIRKYNKEINLSHRKVEIFDLSLNNILNKDFAVFEMSCGKGVYVRALVRDLAKKLNTAGHVTSLRRLQVGPFLEKESISLAELSIASDKGVLNNFLRPLEEVLDDIPAYNSNQEEAKKLMYGQSIGLKNELKMLNGELIVKLDGKLVAICDAKEGKVFPKRVFKF